MSLNCKVQYNFHFGFNQGLTTEMAKIPVLFLLTCMAYLLENSVCTGNNFYYQANLSPQGLQMYPYLPAYAPIWQPDCDKSAQSGESDSSSSEESSSSSSSSESESGESGEEGSSSSSSSSSSESEESGSKESKESGESGESGSSESSSSEEESGSKESSESSESSSSSEEEKKEAPKKKKKKQATYLFPPRAPYTFPARQMQQIIYSAGSPYTYMPYRTSYMVQQPVASYPAKSSYQYISAVPASATVIKGYPSAPVVNKMVSSPVQKIIYTTSSNLNYPAVPKTVFSPGARVYSMPGWNNPVGLWKK